MAKARDVLGIMLTRQCNLACEYCYINEKSDETISVETAKEAITEAFHREGHEADELEIDFVGAEPLSAFETMKEICEWVWAQAWNRPYVFFTSTNGTLLTDSMKEWFTRHKDQFTVGLSYDGIKQAHDVNRSSSYNDIDPGFFLGTWPDQWLKMTISEQSVPFLAESVIKLHEAGARFTVSCAFGEAAWRQSSFKRFAEQLAILVKYYLDHPEMTPVEKLFGINIKGVLATDIHGRKYCGAGTGYYIVDMSGKKYPCHVISPLVMSDFQLQDEGIGLLWNDRVPKINSCSNCILDGICPICYGMSLKHHGSMFTRGSNTCMQFKIQVMANCKLVCGKILRKEQKTADDIRALKAVDVIRKAVYMNKCSQDNARST